MNSKLSLAGLVYLVLFCAPFASLIGAAETIAPANERFAVAEVAETPDFQRHVVPLLGRLGCNSRSCHGSFQGRGGMQLSLFGYDFRLDHDSLTAAGQSEPGRRTNSNDASKSLILRKPLNQVEHEGGQRFEVGSWEHHLMQRWIEAGAQQKAKPRELSHLDVAPREIVFQADSGSVSIQVVAVWEDGTRENVTPLCRFRTNNDSIATVDQDGQIRSTGAGDTHVIAFYDNGMVAVPILRPRLSVDASPDLGAASTLGGVGSLPGEATSAEETSRGIDNFVLAKLQKLQVDPSPICSDTEFLRRVSIDLTGTLPTPGEVTAFLADDSAAKRTHKVDELLRRPAYAAWWANKLCDFTGCNPNQQAELGQETSVQWYMWVYQRLIENMPYDQMVRRIVLAQGRMGEQTYEEYAEQTSAYFRDQVPADFSRRETMPHYWTRRSMQEPEQAAQAFAQNFLGIRMQCAQCHKHPFAPWTQKDYQEFARFFAPVKFGVAPDAELEYRSLAKQVGLNVRKPAGEAIRNETLRQARKGRTIPWRELYIKPREKPETISLLRAGQITLAEHADPREPIMEWMIDPENPYFARAIVNRIWAGYFHVGIVHPTDDLTPANPPSHPDLLTWLSDQFIARGYDMKWLHREIVLSDSYQRSWKPNETNREDRRNFSRAIPRRIPAEVVYDMIKQSLVATDKLGEVRADLTRRAIGHLSMRLAGTHAMRVFGKPDRVVNCDCERVNEPTLLQSLYLQNDPLVEQQLESSGWLQEIAEKKGQYNAAEKQSLVREAWRRPVNRPPNAIEIARALEYLDKGDSMTVGMRDLLWSLMNTKEFILLK
ncbi:MAG: DUF1549 and DUF1553 domain-containing protein [Rubripirellula sp.]|nr:DUF1549 and DUF1553 domain-containing protein [Rubripirellula sp.]